ncbi:MAG: hypothetical protein LCH43_11465 [Actinobacteria bacterium]|nr:hypothetical protein [Actinomycetota bacterium]
MTDFNEYDEGFISLNDAELLALGTGQHRGTVVEFSDDGEIWTETWKPTPGIKAEGEPEQDGIAHPAFARATVTRKLEDGDKVDTRAVVRWDEYVPDLGDASRDNWDRMPTVMLGKVAKVSAYRGAFRDVIGNRYERAELDQAAGRSRFGKPAPGPKEASEEWEKLIAATTSAEEVAALHARIRGLREMSDPLDVLLKERLADFEQAASPEDKPDYPKPAAPKPRPAR